MKEKEVVEENEEEEGISKNPDILTSWYTDTGQSENGEHPPALSSATPFGRGGGLVQQNFYWGENSYTYTFLILLNQAPRGREGVLCFQTVLCLSVGMSGFLLILNKTANYGQISKFKVSMEASQ